MRSKSGSQASTPEKLVRDIRRKTRRHWSAEEKIRIVLEGRARSGVGTLGPIATIRQTPLNDPHRLAGGHLPKVTGYGPFAPKARQRAS